MIKKLFFILLFLSFTSTSFSAELLVRAKPHWMDSFTQSEVSAMTPEQLQSYKARSQVGDIIVVRPDGWLWGKEECLPNYVVVKVPQVTLAEAKKYEESLIDNTNPENPKIIRIRKYALPKTYIIPIKTNSIIITKTALNNILVTKTGLATEISMPVNNPIGYLWRTLANKINPYLKTAYNFYIKKCYAAQFLYKTVKPSGGDYTSLEACMNANEQDLTGDGWFDVEIDGDWSGGADTTYVHIHNYITTSVDYINIYTTATARHTGIRGTGYILAITSAGSMIFNEASYVTINGLSFNASTCTGSPAIYIGYTEVGVIYFINSIVYDYDGAEIIDGFIGGSLYLWNDIFYAETGASTSVIGILVHKYTNPLSLYIYNCTIQTNYVAIEHSTGNEIIINTIGIAPYPFNKAGGSFDASSNYNMDNTSNANYQAPGAQSVHNVTASNQFVNLDAGTENFHLKLGADAIDAGTSLAGTFTDDIDGVTRSGTWDIGADEYVAAGAARRRIWIE